MKQAVSMPVAVGALAVALIVVAFFLVKSVTAEPHTPHPDRSMFIKPPVTSAVRPQ